RVEEAMVLFGRAFHYMRSHSFPAVISAGWSVASTVMITILPVLSISIRAICTPAAATALTALVTSCCRNVDGARVMDRYGRGNLLPASRGACGEGKVGPS